MPSLRVVTEGEVWQGSDEAIAYIFDHVNQGAPSSSDGAAVVLYDTTNQADVSSTKLSGTASFSSEEVTCPAVYALVANTNYKLTCAVTISGNTISNYVVIHGE